MIKLQRESAEQEVYDYREKVTDLWRDFIIFRAEKNYTESDRLKKELEDMGFTIRIKKESVSIESPYLYADLLKKYKMKFSNYSPRFPFAHFIYRNLTRVIKNTLFYK